ncbi:CLUMA_CG021420, isoform A [Clunio marinus]|uniref:CLUMA_CG021420, isoform A n=1 Tax=Clunio marinus TaxID=568069 RepID=A0A1J1J8Z0_9DIPT|nr:CLUMA_CG021420, isoform A [Clunio marinus]
MKIFVALLCFFSMLNLTFGLSIPMNGMQRKRELIFKHQQRGVVDPISFLEHIKLEVDIPPLPSLPSLPDPPQLPSLPHPSSIGKLLPEVRTSIQ